MFSTSELVENGRHNVIVEVDNIFNIIGFPKVHYVCLKYTTYPKRGHSINMKWLFVFVFWTESFWSSSTKKTSKRGIILSFHKRTTSNKRDWHSSLNLKYGTLPYNFYTDLVRKIDSLTYYLDRNFRLPSVQRSDNSPHKCTSLLKFPPSVHKYGVVIIDLNFIT